MNDIDRLKEFKARMVAIAEANGDEFKTTVTFDGEGFHINVTEKADGHAFLGSDGATFAEAYDKALLEINDALEAWGYVDAQ